jgi:outer membrane protein insertion porin family
LCECLVDARLRASQEGRLDFAVSVESADSGEDEIFTARITPGLPYAVGRITFTGHSRLDDSSLRRAMLVRERDLLDIRRLGRSLERINDVGMFEPLTLDDITVDRRTDGVTADITIALRERKLRWWSISSSLLPGRGGFQALIASRLPPWGRGVFNLATSFISLNVVGFGMPFIALERPILPGQWWISGFSIAPQMSASAMLRHYGRAHALYALDGVLEATSEDSFTVPITPLDQAEGRTIVCRRRPVALQWLLRAATMLLDTTR